MCWRLSATSKSRFSILMKRERSDQQDGCGVEGACGLDSGLEVFCQTSIAPDPGEEPLDDPTPRVNGEADLIGVQSASAMAKRAARSRPEEHRLGPNRLLRTHRMGLLPTLAEGIAKAPPGHLGLRHRQSLRILGQASAESDGAAPTSLHEGGVSFRVGVEPLQKIATDEIAVTSE
jgi:hypothetical protein